VALVKWATMASKVCSELHRHAERDVTVTVRPQANAHWRFDALPMLVAKYGTEDCSQQCPGGHRDPVDNLAVARTDPRRN